MPTGLHLVIDVVVIVLALVGVYSLLRHAVYTWWKFRGTRVITCPETKEPAAVVVDAHLAARTAVSGERKLRLRQCSRWPEREDCGQECLEQIELSPEECLVRTMLDEWYQGASCALCHKEIGEINWFKHRPAFMSPDRKTAEWDEIRAEDLPEVLATHYPVCWDCHIIETVRRKYPDRIVYRS
jgi:hypothetical protein